MGRGDELVYGMDPGGCINVERYAVPSHVRKPSTAMQIDGSVDGQSGVQSDEGQKAGDT